VTETRWRVPLSDVIVDDELVESVLEVVRSGWWSSFTWRWLAVGCGAGDEVVVPSLNFVAAANTIEHTGADAVFCDIVGPQELNLDPADVEAAVTPRTKALVVLHYAGYP